MYLQLLLAGLIAPISVVLAQGGFLESCDDVELLKLGTSWYLSAKCLGKEGHTQLRLGNCIGDHDWQLVEQPK